MNDREIMAWKLKEVYRVVKEAEAAGEWRRIHTVESTLLKSTSPESTLPIANHFRPPTTFTFKYSAYAKTRAPVGAANSWTSTIT